MPSINIKYLKQLIQEEKNSSPLLASPPSIEEIENIINEILLEEGNKPEE